MSTLPNTAIPLGYRLPSTVSTGPKPNRVIYRLIDLIYDKNTGHSDVVYINNTDGVNSKSIDQVINDLTPYREAERLVDPPTSPLDVNCKEDCYIVFQLSKKRNWQFSNDGDCFSTKKNEGSKYSELNHVMTNGDRYGVGVEVPDNCRLLYFRAKCDDSTNEDGFNIKIDLVLPPVLNEQTGKNELRRTKIIIDPDIRNPGGSGA